ncbi:adenosylcobinamide-GDP ribazoletransferase [Paracoccus sp. 11-3]|uniref:Adenosylcobinamide-GDP ribazoletransferase n=1 Tax=Paracoccus amoyensis TaxID=2760093 RepID=A0A926JBJ3_9RHOB|nr:adenosylcobinamide-GDP ribazoletransferase [Paracoccus amoyensis]
MVQQLVLALVFLTRLPLGRFLPARMLPLSQSLWAFPLAGLLVGLIAALPLWALGSSLLSAVLSVTLAVWFTGALHEDALADFADAAGGKDRHDRLRIMRDSAIGSYGVMALILCTAMRIAAIAQLTPLAVIAAAIAGRTAVVIAMAILPPARSDGLGKSAGRADAANIAIASLIGGLTMLFLGGPGIAAAIAGLIALGLVIRKAKQWLGGQTGDVLGTASIITETAVLAVLSIFAGMAIA